MNEHSEADGGTGEHGGTGIEEELVLTFRKPIFLGKGDKAAEYLEVTLTEPTTGQLRVASKAGGSIDVLAVLIHLNAKVPMGVVDQMLQRDLDRAGDFFARFGSESPQTSGQSSPS
jgi:hypothetical protein